MEQSKAHPGRPRPAPHLPGDVSQHALHTDRAQRNELARYSNVTKKCNRHNTLQGAVTCRALIPGGNSYLLYTHLAGTGGAQEGHLELEGTL